MNNIEKMRWAKKIIESQTNGLQKMKLGFASQPTIKSHEQANIGMQIQRKMNYQDNYYTYSFYSYIRRTGNYESSGKLQSLIREYQAVADVLKQLERENFILTQKELDVWCDELKQQEELNDAPIMGL